MRIQRRPTPTFTTNQTTHSHQNRLVVFLTSGQEYFTFLYGYTKHNKEVGRKKRTNNRALVSSKRKEGEVCNTFV